MTKINLFKNAEKIETYKAGQVIFKQGQQPSDKMYVVLEGQVSILKGNSQIGLIEEGDILGEMGLIEGIARSATAIARTDCKVIPIDEKYFNFLVQHTPFFANQLLRIMAERLRRMNQLATV